MDAVNEARALCEAYGLADGDPKRTNAMELVGECYARGGSVADCMAPVRHYLEQGLGPLPDDVVPLEG